MPEPETAKPPAPTSLFGLVATPKRPTTIRVLVIAVVIAVVCWYFGADVWHSILFSGALTVIGVIAFVNSGVESFSQISWHDDAAARRRYGSRNEVSLLSSSLRGQHGRVGVSALSRVQELARHRLALHGLDLRNEADRAAIERLIGRGPYLMLSQNGRRRPFLRSLLHCLDVLDTLDHKSALAVSRPRRRTAIFALHLPRRARES